MKTQVINIEQTKTNSRLKYTCDVKIDDWMTWKNVCVFVREDGSRYARLPTRPRLCETKTVYEELVKIEKPRYMKEFQKQVLMQLDRYLEEN